MPSPQKVSAHTTATTKKPTKAKKALAKKPAAKDKIEIEPIDPKKIFRVTFNEITPKAIRAAFEKPRQVDAQLVDAQQARRVLDRIVGYKISPLLWDKVRRGLSAGRVQTVALRLIVEREQEINDFNPVEYWTIDAQLEPAGKQSFTARFVGVNGTPSRVSNGKDEDGKELFLANALPDKDAVSSGLRRARMLFNTPLCVN